jgi:hypothetical protein
MSSSLPPAGWYPDPEGSFRQRWWSGSDWTNDFAQYRPTQISQTPPSIIQRPNTGQAGVANQGQGQSTSGAESRDIFASQPSAQAAAYKAAPPAPPQLPSARADSGAMGLATGASVQTLEHPVVIEAASLLADNPVAVAPQPATIPAVTLVAVTKEPSFPALAVNPSAQSTYEPLSRRTMIRQGARQAPVLRFTAASWVLAAVPILAFATIMAIAIGLPFMATQFTFGLVALSYLLLGFGLAVWDRRVLLINDHERAATAAWALATPLTYLIARAHRVERATGSSAIWPLVVLLVTVAIGAGFAIWQSAIFAAVLAAPLV